MSIYEGEWGDWQSMVDAPSEKYFACGASIQM